jgi:hypothetical protein
VHLRTGAIDGDLKVLQPILVEGAGKIEDKMKHRHAQ